MVQGDKQAPKSELDKICHELQMSPSVRNKGFRCVEYNRKEPSEPINSFTKTLSISVPNLGYAATPRRKGFFDLSAGCCNWGNAVTAPESASSGIPDENT